MARCAVCLTQLARGDRFDLVDEFVVHRHCVGGVIRIRAKAVDLERDRVAMAASIQRMGEEAARWADRIRDLRVEAEQHREDRLELRSRVADLERQLASERNLRALAELEARSIRTTPPPDPQEEISSDQEDETVARFRLLELD